MGHFLKESPGGFPWAKQHAVNTNSKSVFNIVGISIKFCQDNIFSTVVCSLVHAHFRTWDHVCLFVCCCLLLLFILLLLSASLFFFFFFGGGGTSVGLNTKTIALRLRQSLLALSSSIPSSLSDIIPGILITSYQAVFQKSFWALRFWYCRKHSLSVFNTSTLS